MPHSHAHSHEPRTVSIRAWYLDDIIDLKKFRAANPHYPVLAQDPLIIELERDRFAVLTKFGGVVLWNYDTTSAGRLRDELYEFTSDRSFDDRLEEQIPVLIGATQDEVQPNAVQLVKADISRIGIVTRAMAQSVALERLEYQLDDALDPIMVHVRILRDRGIFRGKARDINRSVGFAMAAKHSILKNLTLFDKPDETWESPDLEKLYRALYENTFDLTDRVRALDRKLAFLQDAVEMLLDTINTRTDQHLELAIIYLIVFEIVLTLGEMAAKHLF